MTASGGTAGGVRAPSLTFSHDHSTFAGMAGDGRQIRFRMLHVVEFRAGGISRENVWMDTATVMAQLKAPSAAGVGAAG